MTGKALKDKLYHTGISLTEIAARLNMTPQGLNTIFHVGDIKTGFAERICDVLDMDITDFIPSKLTSPTTPSPSPSVIRLATPRRIYIRRNLQKIDDANRRVIDAIKKATP